MEHAGEGGRPLVLSRAQSNTDKYKYITDKTPRVFHPTILYLLNMPLLRLMVDLLRFSWHVVAFIVSAFSGRILSRRQKSGRTSATAIQPETQFHAVESRQERQLKEHFLVMASHELKTPMTTILGQVQLMLRRLSRVTELSSEQMTMRTALESVDGQARRLNTLIDDLLNLYNLRAGKVKLRLTSCDLVDLCTEVVEEQRPLTGRQIALEVPSAPVILQADRDRLYQVVVNLVNNAIQYSLANSLVGVLVERRRDIGILEVYDSGPAIPKDEQTHIFEPFFRGSNVQASSNGGLGVGLAICKDIVERHSGRIWYRPHKGKGNLFIVELPLSKKANRKLR